MWDGCNRTTNPRSLKSKARGGIVLTLIQKFTTNSQDVKTGKYERAILRAMPDWSKAPVKVYRVREALGAPIVGCQDGVRRGFGSGIMGVMM